MTERRYFIFLAVGMVLWGGLFYLILNHAPRTNNPTDCKELPQHEQNKCKTRRRL
jgi:hypothetical protein